MGMSENGSSFKFFSPLTTPIVARCKLAQQKKNEADFICEFSSDSDTGSIFVTQSKAKKGTKVIKQPKRQVIESIITSLDSIDSGSGPEKLFATKHRKKETKNIKQTQDFINSDLSYVHSGCEKTFTVKKSVVCVDKTNKCSSHGKVFQSDQGKHLSSKLPLSIVSLNQNSSASSPDHGNSLVSESLDKSAPGKSKLDISSCRRKMSSGSSSVSDFISDESIGSEAGDGLASSERKISKFSRASHVSLNTHQTSESESGSDDQKVSKNSFENTQSKSPQKMKSPPQKKYKRMSSSSSDLESETDLDGKNSKPASSKVKISSTERKSITAPMGGSKDSTLKGMSLFESKSVEDDVSDYISESETSSDCYTSPVIDKQNIKRHMTESPVQSTILANPNLSSESDTGKSKSTNHSRKVKRFQCQKGYGEDGNIGDAILPIKKSVKKEFWLIKTPWDFDINKLDRAIIPLAGSIKLSGTEDTKHFEVMAIPKSGEVLKMGTLLADENLDSLVYGPSLAGQFHVIESSASLPLVQIQAQPKSRHQIPQDLKQRYVPFGAKCPVWTIKTNGMADEKKGRKRKHKVEKRKKKKKKER